MWCVLDGLAQNLKPFGANLKTQFQAGLQDASLSVQCAAVECVSSFVTFLEEKAQIQAFAPLVPAMLKVLQAALAADAELEAADIMKVFVDLAR